MCVAGSNSSPQCADRPAILIVEDHPAMLDALLRLLRSAFPGCRVFETDNGERALELCKVESPAIIVMDIGLPEMNGIEATRQIKALDSGIQVVMHSSSDAPVYREQSLAAGAVAFVGKRHTARELVPTITRLLPGAGISSTI